MTDGENIIKIRREKGISQEELAVALNVSRQAVSKWENDLMQISVDKRAEIEAFFGVSVFNEEVAAAKAEKIRFTANQKIVLAIIAVFIALSFAVTVIVGIVSIPDLWADEKSATNLYVDFGYFWLALGITLIITAIEIFAVLVYRKENGKNV